MHKQQGLSLIELMISITLGIVLMTGVVQMFITSRTTFSTQQAVSRVQESGRMAMEFMARDVRMAGYMGCSRHAEITNGLASNSDHQFQFDASIQGFAAANNPLGVNVSAPGTDVLVVRRASEQQAYIMNATPPNANMDVAGVPVNNCLSGICIGDAAIISDCVKGRLFRVTNLQGLGGGFTRIVHSPGGPAPSNVDTSLGGQEFGPGAEVLSVRTITYYVAASEVSPNTLSLWQNVSGVPAELVTGIQNMSLRYGEDTSNNGLPNEYREAGDVSNWGNVVSISIRLLVQSTEDNVIPEPQPYSFAGIEYSSPADIGDRRLRQVFANTIAIRNRM
jgi:type IV pilus assembly protein PilW